MKPSYWTLARRIWKIRHKYGLPIRVQCYTQKEGWINMWSRKRKNVGCH